MAANRDNPEDNLCLKELFERASSLQESIENSDDPSNSENLQKNIARALEWLAETTEMVNQLGFFSSNEDLEEVSTTDLRYFLLPALSGDLILRQFTKDRITNVKIAKIYFIDFLKRCKDYGITNQNVFQLSESNTQLVSGAEGLKQMAKSREEKIKRYKEQKQQENRLVEFKKNLEGKSLHSADDELQREYYLLLIKTWVNKSTEHLSSIKDELEILEHMEKIKIGYTEKQENQPQRKVLPAQFSQIDLIPLANFIPIKPILITKETIKAKVFGAGYPSVPKMTQQENLEKEIKEGKVVLEYESGTAESCSKLKESNDGGEDDFEELYKARSMDDWKDDHRRGWGNRENMG